MHRVLDPRRHDSFASKLCALAIMTKAPRAGTVKTRLQPPLTAEEAAQLNVCFLRDIAAAIVSTGGESKGVGVFTPVGCEEGYMNILPSDFVLIPQRGDSFGERLMNAATDLLRVGFESCCLINSDSPTVTADAFRQAMAKLQGADNRIVLARIRYALVNRLAQVSSIPKKLVDVALVDQPSAFAAHTFVS